MHVIGEMIEAVIFIVVIAAAGGGAFFSPMFAQQRRDRELRAAKRAAAQAKAAEEARLEALRAMGPVIPIAIATGKLRERGHVSSVKAGETISIDCDMAYGGTVVVGPMGSGKSRAILQRFTAEWLTDPRAGVFAYGVKPNWSETIAQIARTVGDGRPASAIHIVGPDHEPWPLIRGLEPDAVANFCSEAFHLAADSHSGDQFFQASAVNLVRYAAAILEAAAPLDVVFTTEGGEVVKRQRFIYNFVSISELVHATKDEWKVIARAGHARAAELLGNDREKAEDLQRSIAGFERLTKDLPERTRGGVLGQIDTVIEPFLSNRALQRAFCGEEEFAFEAALDNGEVVILDVDLGRYAASARLVYLLAFEQMRRYMLRRIERLQHDDRLTPIGFIADEYASVACKQHKDVWRLCRESQIAPVLAFQLMSDLRAVVGGRDEADGLIAGMRQKILFRTDDSASLDLVAGALGKAEVVREHTSESTSESEGSSSGNQGGGGSHKGTSTQTQRSRNIVERGVVDAQLMQSLQSHIRRGVPIEDQWAEAIYVGEDAHGRRIADVVKVFAWDPPSRSYAAETADAV
jgi:hypothetical protein